MSDTDRFTQFLRREGAGYHRPPETPADSIWPGVEARLAGGTDGVAGEADPVAGVDMTRTAGAAIRDPINGLGYNEAPAVPRDEMWQRIEAAWALRRSAGPAADEPGFEAAAPGAWPRPWTRQRRVVVAGWVASLAAAASLVLGLALGLGGPPAQPGEAAETLHAPIRVTDPDPAPVAGVVTTRPVAVDEAPGPGPRVAAAPAAAARNPAVTMPNQEAEPAGRVAGGALPIQPVGLPDPFEVADEYATSSYLRRAATLLTAFRTDQATPDSQRDLARWGRQLLGETRTFLDMPVSPASLERALLEDLELVLVQIASLGPGTPDFERQLARESMEWQGTFMRLRTADAAGAT